MESLQAIIRDKTDDHAALLTANQQNQRDLEERNDEIDKLAGRIRELEQALLNSTESNRATLQLEQELHRVKLREQELIQVKKTSILSCWYFFLTMFLYNLTVFACWFFIGQTGTGEAAGFQQAADFSPAVQAG